MYKNNIDEIYGIENEDGNIELFYVNGGEVVTYLNDNVYPVGSGMSAKYEHPNGICLEKSDALGLGIFIEKH